MIKRKGKPNKSNKIATQINDEIIKYIKYKNNVQLKGIKKSLTKEIIHLVPYFAN